MRITVNDEAVPFFMKVGETGEAFFVFETDAEVPEELQTSPLAGPVGDEDVEGQDGDQMVSKTNNCMHFDEKMTDRVLFALDRSPTSSTWTLPRTALRHHKWRPQKSQRVSTHQPARWANLTCTDLLLCVVLQPTPTQT